MSEFLERYKFLIMAVVVLLALGFIVSQPLVFGLLVVVGYVAYKLK